MFAMHLIYKLVDNCTGRLGCNGSGGLVYGELVISEMQQIIKILINECEFGKLSRFIDIGSGQGKPSMHVTQYLGVAFGCGIEIEPMRAFLGNRILYNLLKEAQQDNKLGFNCLFNVTTLIKKRII